MKAHGEPTLGAVNGDHPQYANDVDLDKGLIIIGQVSDNAVHGNGKSEQHKGPCTEPGNKMWFLAVVEEFVGIPKDGSGQGENGEPKDNAGEDLHDEGIVISIVVIVIVVVIRVGMGWFGGPTTPTTTPTRIPATQRRATSIITTATAIVTAVEDPGITRVATITTTTAATTTTTRTSSGRRMARCR